ncbi:HEAT repeat domain-containing protein [Streptomyces sp. NPDC015171]|uniref:HEAT repeat domain-containing protein n=1 Tax=Streptomyces sp. NPDC015171 TaxID=3364945 RepID=UPI0036F86281
MFRGIEDVDWASLGHAYTDSATDVPDLLRGLASDDPERREIALDGMYGAVLHQGTVYDSTVACVPFLFELIANEAVAGRGDVVALLHSIADPFEGEDEGDEPDEGDAEESGFWEAYDAELHEEWQREYFVARDLIRGRAEAFLDLLDDPDPGVRAAVPAALARLHPEPVRVFGVLRGRLAAESDPEATRRLARALSVLAVRHPDQLRTEAAEALRGLLGSTRDAELRLTALIALARCAPAELPPDTVRIASEVLRQARETAESNGADGAPLPAGPLTPPRTDTHISYVRELYAEHRRSLGLDDRDELVQELHTALRDRTDIRFPLLVDQLRGPDLRQRRHAAAMAGCLLTGWRAPDDTPLLALAGQLTDEDLRLQKSVLSTLVDLAPAAHRVSEHLVTYIAGWADRPIEKDTPFPEMALGMAYEVLALQGDTRIVPALVALLEVVDLPERLPRWVAALGPEAAATLGPVLHERLAALDPGPRSQDRDRLVDALGVLRHAGSVPLLVRVLAAAEQPAGRERVLAALARHGRAAAEAAPLIGRLWDRAPAGEERIHLAEALWALNGDTEAVLPVVRDAFGSRGWRRWRTALRLTEALGRSGAALAPRLRELIAAGHSPALAAIALWQVTGDADEVLPVLLEQWPVTPREWPAMAACLAAMGGTAAPALPLIRAQLAAPRHHQNYDARPGIRYDVTSDVALLTDCRRVLAECGERPEDVRIRH